MSSIIRVVVADDEELVRAGLRMMLDSKSDIEVVAEAGDGAQAVECAERLREGRTYWVTPCELRVLPRYNGRAGRAQTGTDRPQSAPDWNAPPTAGRSKA